MPRRGPLSDAFTGSIATVPGYVSPWTDRARALTPRMLQQRREHLLRELLRHKVDRWVAIIRRDTVTLAHRYPRQSFDDAAWRQLLKMQNASPSVRRAAETRFRYFLLAGIIEMRCARARAAGKPLSARLKKVEGELAVQTGISLRIIQKARQMHAADIQAALGIPRRKVKRNQRASAKSRSKSGR
jgi:hypothetical protein